MHRARQRLQREPRASRRSTADSLWRINAAAQLQPRFLGRGVIGRYPHLPLSTVQRAPRRPVINTGRAVSGAAWERMYRPPAGTALAPRFGSTLTKVSLYERASAYVTETVTNVKRRI